MAFPAGPAASADSSRRGGGGGGARRVRRRGGDITPAEPRPSGACHDGAVGEVRAVVRGRGQRLEEALRELLLLGPDRLRAGDGRGAALRRAGEPHRIIPFGKAEGHEEGRVVDLERERLAVRRALHRQEEREAREAVLKVIPYSPGGSK